jgi:hypothetical protein
MIDAGLCKVDYRAAPGVTAAIVTSGVVLSYVAEPSLNIANPLPWLVTSTNPALYISFRIGAGRVTYYNLYINSLTGGIVPNPAYLFRYVIVPGSVAGGRGYNEKVVDVNGQTYSESQLQAMSYAQVCRLFRIPQ